MRVLSVVALLIATPAAAETLIVGNKGENTVSFIDLATGQERARVKTGENPHEVAVSPDGARAAVVHYGAAAIDIFDVASGRLVATHDLNPNTRPHGLVWLADGRLVVTTEGADTLTVLDAATGRLLMSVPTGNDGSHMVAVHPRLPRAFVANLGAGNASVINIAEGKKLTDLAAGRGTEGIALTPDGGEVWISSREANQLHVYDAVNGKLLATIATGNFPLRVAISPDGRHAVTSNLGDGALGVYDVATRTLARTIPVSGSADSRQVTILFRPDGRRLYVAETASARVAELEWPSGRLLRRFVVGKDGDGLGWSPK
jgi:YVTN family beta-propeller protein